ncbi:hypothetical protein FOA52_006643 [Chlamydomonas sp. UWO 241]|nr:hypothetical protein FOA52_006643 [Chlamydomonas sp. UWO 241]
MDEMCHVVMIEMCHIVSCCRSAANGDAGHDDDDAEEEEEVVSLAELTEVLSLPRAGKDYSAAIWRPELYAAELVKSRKGTAQQSGFSWRRRHYLHIEEAVFYIDRGDLLLFVEVDRQQRLLSVQEAYDLMVTSGVGLDRYLVYSFLMRSGYVVVRYPSLWVLAPDASPSVAWAEWVASGGGGARFDGGGGARICGGDGARLDGSGGARIGVGGGAQADQGGEAAAGHSGSQRADGAGGGDTHMNEAAAASTSVASAALGGSGAPGGGGGGGRWWPRADAEHPLLAGVPREWFDSSTGRHAIEMSPGDALRTAHPRLRPLGPIPDGPHLGPHSARGTLLYDVSKPGSKLGRKARQFPPVMHHVAICHLRPPTLREMRSAAAAAAAFPQAQAQGAPVPAPRQQQQPGQQQQQQGAGPAAASAPVVWASVDTAIVSFFQVVAADLLPLV